MTKESQNIEWKQSWNDDYLKWVCGFANAQGGRIYIGKDDAGNVTGLKNAKKLLEDLPNKIRDQLGLMPHINLLQEDGKAFLEIIVEPSTVPISLRGSYYWRSGSVKQELKGHALTEFLLKKMGMTWDHVINEKASLEDIDETSIALFKKKAATAGRLPDISGLPTKELLKKLHLLTEDGLTNAAIVLFGKDPGEYYPNLFVKIGRFGTSVVDMRFQEVCEGNLFQILHDVMEQLEKKFLIKPVRFEGLSRIEELDNQLGNQLGNTKERILAEMKANPKISGAQLAELLDISTTAVEKNIKQLREDGLIKRIGGTRGHWEVVERDEG